MRKLLCFASPFLACFVVGINVCSADEQSDLAFYEDVFSAAPYEPADTSHYLPSCVRALDSADYKTVAESGMSAGWHNRVAHDWAFFNVPASQSKITVIDYAQTPSGLGYRYLANANTQSVVYEPWSSSKVMAIVGALSKFEPGVAADTLVGNAHLADLVTSVHSYAEAGVADGNSNAIATYFANVAGRDYLTQLFHSGWINTPNANVRFRGAYGPVAFMPESDLWTSASLSYSHPVAHYAEGPDDPGYQSYRCDDCGLTGNKPMSTLAEAEFLKRLMSGEREPLTQLPGFDNSDLTMLLYAPGHNSAAGNVGGMMSGIGLMLARSIAATLAPGDKREPNVVLDELTAGKWRIFQKIGAGPSETRQQGETVLLAHVCLPMVQGGREFTLAVQSEVPGINDAAVGRAAMAMQATLDQSMAQLLAH
ncbi:hypothetical protein FJ444_18140 [Aestuariibacter sp. GS-14]|uniref:hypothetical protein n=1 Tax=Aestuariibacter sp. GS-14 TaxID=2590670 RepID=UPI00112BE10A|nr:hypothetical protein [Aestuariibacter sp. GS-14]TPV54778.1 hypothetical protein FJ444_18140 [Aestuariibacter sp. GS-14]